jgi:hypothetical protein
MLSNLCELAGMAMATTGVWELAGRPWGLIFGGACAVVVGLGADGIRVALPRRRKNS